MHSSILSPFIVKDLLSPAILYVLSVGPKLTCRKAKILDKAYSSTDFES